MSNATLHFDGGSRGNPGPAAAAAVLSDGQGVVLAECSEYLGEATNNVAEYTGLIIGLKKALELGLKRLDIYGDSELIIKQIKGEYRVKNPGMKPLYQEATALLTKFEWQITHVLRAENKEADSLVNLTLDQEAS